MGKILVVDDLPQFREATVKLLQRAGHETVEAADGGEGLRQFAAQQPDIVITDLFMPGTDGLEFIRMLGEARPGTKVIAVSGGGFWDAQSILEVAKMIGALRTLSKPLDPAALLKAVDELLGGGA